MSNQVQTPTQNLMDAHAQWAHRPADQRFETLADLRAFVHSRRQRSRSLDVDRNDVIAEVEGENGIVINNRITACAPSHWAFGQLCQASRLNGVAAPASYMRQLPATLAVKCLNEGFRNGEREAHKFMTIASDSGGVNTLQAVTSTTYGRIWDADVVDGVQRIVERTGGRFSNPKAYAHKPGVEVNGFKSIDTSRTVGAGLYASDHDVFIFMVDGGSYLDGGPRAQLYRGFINWNSETGAKTYGAMTFLMNGCCGNHIIYGARDVNKLIIRHSSGGPYRFDAEAAPMLKAYCEASAGPVLETIKRAQEKLIWDGKPASMPGLLEWMGKHGKFTRGEISSAVDFAKSEEGDCRTLWQLVQGFTAYARGFDFIDSRVDLEKRAGALLDVVANN